MLKAPGGPPATPPRVVIADDDEGILTVLSMMFERDGFHTTRASDGFEALRAIEAEDPDLIVLDLMMPHRNGFQVVKDLQETRHRNVPILAYTARMFDSGLLDLFEREPNVAHFEEKMRSPRRLPKVAREILKERGRRRNPEELAD